MVSEAEEDIWVCGGWSLVEAYHFGECSTGVKTIPSTTRSSLFFPAQLAPLFSLGGSAGLRLLRVQIKHPNLSSWSSEGPQDTLSLSSPLSIFLTKDWGPNGSKHIRTMLFQPDQRRDTEGAGMWRSEVGLFPLRLKRNEVMLSPQLCSTVESFHVTFQ